MNDIFTQSILLICAKKPNERTENELDLLIDLTKSTEIFKNLIEENGPSIHSICCKYLHYKFLTKGSFPFRYGDKATCFYIIVKGLVSSLVPTKNKLNEQVFEEIDQFKSGMAFGEVALDINLTRQTSARCLEDTHLLYLEKKDYVRLIGNLIKKKRDSIVDFLLNLPILSSCTRGTLTSMTYAFKERKFNKAQIVYREGDESGEIFFVRKGEFKFSRKINFQNPDKLSSKKQLKSFVIAQYGTGKMFGEEDTLQGMKRKNTCICMENESVLMVIGKDDFLKQVSSHPGLFEFVSERVKVKIEDFDKRVQVRGSFERFPKVKHLKSKTSIIEDLKNDLSKRCKIYCAVGSEESRSSNRTVSHGFKKKSQNFKSFGSKIFKSFDRERKMVSVNSERVMPKASVQKRFLAFDGFSIISLGKDGSQSSIFKTK